MPTWLSRAGCCYYSTTWISLSCWSAGKSSGCHGFEWLHIIATTSRDKSELLGTQRDRAILTLGDLSEEEALALIERYQPNGKFPDEATKDTANGIVKSIGGFTLALEAAAVFLAQCARGLRCAAFHDPLRGQRLTEVEVAAVEPRERSRQCRISLSANLRSTLEQMERRND